jgi:Fe-S-cluster containining protein
VYGDCQHLLPDNRCGNYEDRPQICRDYNTDACEYDDPGVHERLFETPEQLWEYAEAIFPPKRKSRKKAIARVSLPILG